MLVVSFVNVLSVNLLVYLAQPFVLRIVLAFVLGILSVVVCGWLVLKLLRQAVVLLRKGFFS